MLGHVPTEYERWRRTRSAARVVSITTLLTTFMAVIELIGTDEMKRRVLPRLTRQAEHAVRWKNL